MVLLGPIANEIEGEVATIFAAETLVAAVPQGWMRRWDGDGRVHARHWENAGQILSHHQLREALRDTQTCNHLKDLYTLIWRVRRKPVIPYSTSICWYSHYCLHNQE